MAKIFLPSCKITAGYPKESEALAKYIQKKFGIEPLGCCRVNYQNFTDEDTVIVICNNCSKIVEESSKAGNIQFVWDIIDSDSDFVFPNYHGESMTIQDCWITKDNKKLQNTVRSLMKKMNIKIVEIENCYEKTDYCGINLVNPATQSNQQLAPNLWLKRAPEIANVIPKDKQAEYFKEYCKKFKTDKVVCYCKSCVSGINMGEKIGVHLIELLFPIK